MPSGGNWTPADPGLAGARPGIYANLVAAVAAALSPGVRGIVAMPVTADWGPLRTIVDIHSQAELKAAFGDHTKLNGTAYAGIYEALRGGAATIKAWRMAGAAAAKATRIILDGTAGTAITLTAKYEGARGSGFTVDVVTNAVNGAAKDVKISEGGVLLETHTGLNNAEIVASITATSKYVTAVAGGGTFVANVAGSAFAGGNSGLTVLAADWNGAMDALEPQKWDVFAPVALTDPAILPSIFTWIKALRDNGNKVYLVIGSAAAETITTAKTNAALYAHEGVVYAWPGVTQDVAYMVGKALSGAQFIGRIAGLIASKGTDKSLTFAALPGVTAAEKTPTNAEVKSGLAGGVMVLTGSGEGSFHVEQGINTLVTPGTGQNNTFKKIRIVRILDLIFNTLTTQLATEFIGDIENDEDGQKTVIGAILGFLSTLSASRYIEPEYTVALDTANASVADRMFLSIAVKPIDSVDFVYITINVG